MKTNTTQTPNLKLAVCEGCKETGGVGAKWLLYIDGQSQPKLVHRPCGETLMANAPEGIKVNLVPSRQLRDEWRAKRMASDFWGHAFKDAKPLKSASKVLQPVVMKVVTPPPMTPVLTEVAQAM